MKFGSLFSGIGGFDLALENAGMDCAWQCEIDPKASAILKNHWPDVPNIGDVKLVGRNAVEPVDLICGGFPCQDLSVAGKRAGLAGERSGLWFEFARVIDELEPRWVIVENVPGLLSSNRGADFAIIIQWLADRGYGVAWRVLDAQFFGVAQRRRRVFIVASFGNGRAAEVLFEREGLRWDTPQGREAGKEVAAVTASSIEARSYKGINSDNLDHMVTGTLDGKCTAANKGSQANETEFLVMAHGQANAEITEDMSPTLNVNHEQPIIAFNARRTEIGAIENQSPTLNSGGGGFQSPGICWEMSHPDDPYREAGELAPTLQSRMGTGGNQIPLVGVRRLTPVECERLQGFPDGWTDGQADSARYRQLGNAVAVPVVEWIARRIVEASQ